jgi:dolichol kinase
MLNEIPYVLLITGAVMIGLYLANLIYDTGMIAHHVSRKFGHLGGCVGYMLIPFVFSSFWWPLILTSGFTALLLYARWKRPATFRGTGGSGRPQALAEIHFPAISIPIIAVGWGYLHQPWLAIVPLLFMAGGDSITGLIRNRLYKREMKGWWGSLGMFFACLLLAYFFKPYWISAVGAVIAVIAERYTPAIKRGWFMIDDNLTIPLFSFIAMALLYLKF